MRVTKFYDFELTTGSSIQAEALFDIFDELTSIGNRIRSHSASTTGIAKYSGRTESNHKEDP